MSIWTSYPAEDYPMNSDDCTRYRLVAEARMRGENDATHEAEWSRTMEDRFPSCTVRISNTAWRRRAQANTNRGEPNG